ncbi:hypothetical protein Pcinc_031715 [Petrolisthes cinctipes]|uniref:Small ribosomal subunit protein bS6m n=1 Tax=Petrolisthes cinctipes TaxID=88211 RepID=A0AAE1EW02_PETCI|nr:hypothetical protein Pcinc_031715 [Petrolisthes cinctipes]
MPKVRTVETVKRVAESILDEGCYLNKIESLGVRELPYKIRNHGRLHSRGNYFLVRFVAPPSSITNISDNCLRDLDIIRPFISKVEGQPAISCSLHQDLKPPAFRPEVHQMMEEAKKRVPIYARNKFKLNTPMGYNPF